MDQSLTQEHLAITGISHIELRVTDLDASKAWYEKTVGMIPIQGTPGKFAVLAPKGDGSFRLGLSQHAPEDVYGRFGHIAIALESMEVLDAWTAHLDSLDVAHTPIKENPFRPGVFSIDVFDPDGHEIELIFEPFETRV